MPVVGKHAYIIAETGKKVDVSPFTPDYKPLMVPLVDATVRYDNPYNGKSYILVLWNALYVPSMDNNLIPPFMIREMGVTVNDIPKIHKEDPTVDDHAITFFETGFRIPLSLWGIFSYILTSKPTHDDLLNPNEVYIVENSSSRFYLISCSQGILNSSRLLLLSSPKIACLHVSFTAYENFYKLSKMHCHLVLTFLFLILRMSECRNPTIKHISTYTLVSSSITTYVTDLFLGSNLHSKIPF